LLHRADVANPGAIHQHVEPTKSLYRGRDRLLDTSKVRNVRSTEERRIAQFGSDLLTARGVQLRDKCACTLFGRRKANGGADSAPTTRHQDYFVIQSETRHASSVPASTPYTARLCGHSG